MSKSAALNAYQLSFETSPIVLTNGIAQFIPGGMLPIISITESLNFIGGFLSGSADLSLDRAFAKFKPMPGATLVENQYGKYTFANQSVAANAVIGEPLKVAMMMILQIRSLPSRLAIMTALQKALTLHSNLGGTYTVVTPSYVYTNCLLDSLTAVGDTATIMQDHWQWTFEQPLLTEQDALFSYGSLISKITGGLPSTGALSGAEVTTGVPLSLATSSVAPAASGLLGTGTASYNPPI
jgi:hypothetical protein